MLTNAPANWKSWIKEISNQLHGRSKWRLGVIFFGIIFAQGKKTVTSWLRAAGIGKGYQEFYYFLATMGRKTEQLAHVLLQIVFRRLLRGRNKVVAAIDDSPTRRYGPKVEGAGIHHDGTSKPTDQTLLFGHCWVTLALIVEHTRWGTIALPLLSKLYIRACDVLHLPAAYEWVFKTKLELASELVDWLHRFCLSVGIVLWVVFDGGYSKRNFLKKLPVGVVGVGRLRHDAALRDLPAPRRPGQRGAPRKYGQNKINLAKRAGQRRGWQDVIVRGKAVKFKVFQATYRQARGKILVEILRYKDGSWAAHFCTNPDADPIEVIEVIMDRWAIEENFKEVKETLGAGEQQVRNLWANIACWHLCLWTFVLVHLWSWGKSDDDLKDRSASPWDCQVRRPSLADRIRSLRRIFLGYRIIDTEPQEHQMPIIRRTLQFLCRLVC